MVSDGDMVSCDYTHPNRGSHPVTGVYVFEQRVAPNMVKVAGGFSFNYGYRGGGEQFLVHKMDIEVAPHWFRPVVQAGSSVVALPDRKVQRPAPPAPIARPAPPTRPKPEPAQDEVRRAQLEDTVLADLDEAAVFDFQTVPGITDQIAEQFVKAGFVTLNDVLDAGDQLQEFRGIGPTKQERILDATRAMLAEQAKPPPDLEQELARLMQ